MLAVSRPERDPAADHAWMATLKGFWEAIAADVAQHAIVTLKV
jgi:hypothetical protein